MARCEETNRGLQCMLEAPHPTKHHRHERKSTDSIYRETWVLIWQTPDLDVVPHYDEGTVELEPWIVRGEEYVG